ncbi:putative F420-0 ABC transporter substrate-binding protein [Microbacterium sp. KKR3/1]|uniref:putative F420-0 ABC transporter substrate-binding protein n=1 Tax=Microbacterium sp. KKR3/1 TaxID=2904241 RepID=UPI001E635D08|nr:putative F420-0 ABC transporter substrate-binding protein [Microbacterium sp. KKR3/1]MCE0509673.1 putative F420-0 ABC transporter substrate-binding protein [Microbacterium sp. KKR3/1]
MPATTRALAATPLLALLVAAGLSGCNGAPAAPAAAADPKPLVLDNCGTEVPVEAAPQRILTIKSSTLELALALGAGDRIIGSAFSDGPLPDDLAASAEGIDVVSDKVPSKEAVLELEPDLVFAGWESNFSVDGAGERADLQKLGITTYVAPAACKAPGYMPDPLTFDAVFDGFAEAGQLLGEQDAASALIAEQRAALDEIAPDDRGLTALWYSSGTDQPFVGAGIGAPQMIMSAAGLDNVFADVHDTWTSSSWELIAEADPDVIVLVDAAWNTAESKIALLTSNPVTSELDAVQNQRFVIVDFPATEAGIRNVDAVESIVTQLGER